ncbi:MAG: YqaJ viral recombinase family protein [Lachnospiraceae bacterium]
MNRLVSTKEMEYEVWLNWRKKGIGGSDAGAVCGLNPYTSPMQVYVDMTSEEVKNVDNEAMRQGRDLEDYVAKRFEEATGKKVRNTNFIYGNQKYPYMLANVDRLVVGENAGLECKTANAFQADKWEDGNLPPHYQIQCHHYMAVTNAKAWYLAVVILGRDFKYYKIERDESLIQYLVSIEGDFWNNHVVPGIMPSPDGSEASEEALKKYFKNAASNKVVPLIGFNDKLVRRNEIEELLKKMEQEKKQIEQEIKMYMADADVALDDQFIVSWKNIESSRLNTKKLKEEQPDIFEAYSMLQLSRRFQIRSA